MVGFINTLKPEDRKILLNVKEQFGDLSKVHLAFVGDGNNVCHSLMLVCAKTGLKRDIRSGRTAERSYLTCALTVRSSANPRHPSDRP